VCVLQAPPPPPQTAADAETEKNLRDTFKKISGVDLEVDAYELRDILNVVFMKGLHQLLRISFGVLFEHFCVIVNAQNDLHQSFSFHLFNLIKFSHSCCIVADVR